MPDLPTEDRLAIGALVTEYAWLLDHRRWHEVADLCTEPRTRRAGPSIR